MDRRQFLRRGVLGGAALLGAPFVSTGRCRLYADQRTVEVSTRAIDRVLDSKVVDMLGLLTFDWPRLYRWQRRPETFTRDDYWHLEPEGVDVYHPAVEPGGADPPLTIRRWLAGWNALLDRHACFLARVESVTDLFDVPTTGKLGVLVGFQNSTHFRTVADVAEYYALGQRVSQLTYDTANALGCGCRVRDRGLTAFGARVVGEMNRLGMAVDVSHCGERTSLDAIAASRRPVLITHANCRALVPGHPRCKSDETIRRMAMGGGVMGITFVRSFVSRGRSRECARTVLDLASFPDVAPRDPERATLSGRGFEVLAQGEGVVEPQLLGAEDQGDVTVAHGVAELLKAVRIGVELGGIARLELRPLVGVVTVPAAQLGRRRDVPRPVVDPRPLLGQPARPQPVDEDAAAVVVGRRVVDAADVDGHAGNIDRGPPADRITYSHLS